jgi:intermembrane space import and assembly protein 40
VPAQPPSTTAKDTPQASQIGKGPVVEGRESAERTGGSEFNDTDVAGDSVGGTSPEQDDEASSAEGGSSKGTGDPKTQGAFNEETGEINWDCPVRARPLPAARDGSRRLGLANDALTNLLPLPAPPNLQCLGGMPHGPCGPQFRAAFSCFVYSEEEPKGIECVEKFKDMQECFRAHPDVYGECEYSGRSHRALQCRRLTPAPISQPTMRTTRPSRPSRPSSRRSSRSNRNSRRTRPSRSRARTTSAASSLLRTAASPARASAPRPSRKALRPCAEKGEGGSAASPLLTSITTHPR